MDNNDEDSDRSNDGNGMMRNRNDGGGEGEETAEDCRCHVVEGRFDDTVAESTSVGRR